jgi:DNA-binding response OmpR family regulator
MTKGRVLLAHGNADCRKIFGSVLAFDGYDVEVVDDGESALRLLASLPFDILVTDLYLASSGDECVPRSVRARSSLAHLPIVVLTGWCTEPHRIVAFETGADAFLPLPVRPRELLDICARLLGEAAAVVSSVEMLRQHDRTISHGL